MARVIIWDATRPPGSPLFVAQHRFRLSRLDRLTLATMCSKRARRSSAAVPDNSHWENAEGPCDSLKLLSSIANHFSATKCSPRQSP